LSVIRIEENHPFITVSDRFALAAVPIRPGQSGATGAIPRRRPVFAVFPLQVAIGLLGADDRFALGVELQLAVGARDNVGQMRVGSRDVSQLDLGVRRLAAAYAINEITGVGVWFVLSNRTSRPLRSKSLKPDLPARRPI